MRQAAKARKVALIDVGILDHHLVNGPEIGLAMESLHRIVDHAERRHQHGDQQNNNGYDHEQFNQRERLLPIWFHRLS
jgi:hypothetical protein